MSPEETDLARLLVALPGWRWVPGMLVCVPGDRGHIAAVLDGGEGLTVYVCFDEETPSCRFDEEIGLLLPCLTHMGTAGVLLGMLRAAVPHWPVEVLMLRAHVEVCVGSPGSGGRTVHVGSVLGVAVARALVAIGRCA